MNPRDFAREPGYDFTIALTYSFDPLFFEKVVLHDLRTGQSGSVLVVGDPHEITTAISNAQLPLEHLGRRYMLSQATHSKGAFHPKITLRLGNEDGQVLVGSGNLTRGGWGGNRELGTQWKIGPTQDDQGSWIIPLLVSIESWCSGDREREVISRAKLIPWIQALKTINSNKPSSLLYSQAGSTLAQQLEARWSGRRFEKLLIATGSSDDKGAMLRWAHDTFGVTEVIVAGTVSSLSFDPALLDALPCTVRIKAIEAPFLHAKFYWFEGSAGPAVVFGSANCSAAAWLLNPANGGNIETIVCFDQPKLNDFSEPLTLFAGETSDPAAVLSAYQSVDLENETGVDDAGVYRITTLDWDRRASIATFVITPPPPVTARVTLVISETSSEAQSSAIGSGRFQANFSETFTSSVVLYGFAVVTIGELQHKSSKRWVDCIFELEQSRSAARIVDPLFALEEDHNKNGQRKVVKAIQLIVQTLFSDAGHFPDPDAVNRQSAREAQRDNTVPVQALDPLKVLYQPSETDSDRDTPVEMIAAASGTVSVSGILGSLYLAGNGRSTSEYEEEVGDAEDDSQKPVARATARNQLGERYVQQLANQVGGSIDKLIIQDFMKTCTAVQFVQATAFPLAVAALGRQQGWVSTENASKWTIRLFGILFEHFGHGIGLLNKIEERYQAADKAEIFEAAVGDGSLWAALVASLVNAPWQVVGAEFEKALAVRQLFREPSLIKTASAADLLRYAKALRSKNATEILTIHAPSIVSALEDLELKLKPYWSAELAMRQGAHIQTQTGDLLWQHPTGWAVVLGPGLGADQISVRFKGTKRTVMQGFYFNVSDLARREPQFADLVSLVIERTQAFESN